MYLTDHWHEERYLEAVPPTPRFKVGDWVRLDSCVGRVTRFVPNPPNEKGVDCYHVMTANGKELHVSSWNGKCKLEPWQPREGEWVMAKNRDGSRSQPIQLTEMIRAQSEWIPAPFGPRAEEWSK